MDNQSNVSATQPIKTLSIDLIDYIVHYDGKSVSVVDVLNDRSLINQLPPRVAYEIGVLIGNDYSGSEIMRYKHNTENSNNH